MGRGNPVVKLALFILAAAALIGTGTAAAVWLWLVSLAKGWWRL